MAKSPTLLRRQLGRFLRDRREATGMTIVIAAAEVQLSSAALQRLEAGRSKNPRKQDVRELCNLYEVDPEETERTVDLAIQAASNDDDGITALGGMFSDAFNMYAGMERSARSLVTFQELVPGLLQTPDYARGLIGAFLGEGRSEETEQRVTARMARQVIVTRKGSPLRLEVLLHESALHRVIGGPQVMDAQLSSLAEVSKRPNVILRVQPFNAGCTWGKPPSPFVILDFGTDRGARIEPPVVYLDGSMSSDLYIEKQEIVERYHELASEIRRTALDEVDTRHLLRQTVREHYRDR
ncbi:helix-turn-helix transcriptional regulator [Nocardia sp. CNY236]|uniref:helix-turn-helix domain-containing protein n=1 Tax=Nocardia sp. CNY236 TaxID=1169152 RepID=UPI00048B7894|nr:helix-turn-helix transcriptional regulator [Nocardia sp. CNY236]